MFFWRKRKSSGWNLIIGDGGKAGLDPDLLQLSSEEKKQLMYDAVYLPMCMCVGVCCFLPQQAPWTIDAAAEGLIQLVVIVDNPHVFSLEVGLCSTMFNFNYYSTIEYSDVRINIDVQNPHQLVNVTTHTSADFGWSRCHLEIKGLRKYQSISLCFFAGGVWICYVSTMYDQIRKSSSVVFQADWNNKQEHESSFVIA
jgi:hypothetical protein